MSTKAEKSNDTRHLFGDSPPEKRTAAGVQLSVPAPETNPYAPMRLPFAPVVLVSKDWPSPTKTRTIREPVRLACTVVENELTLSTICWTDRKSTRLNSSHLVTSY